jgi:hypothetical protein
MKWRTMSDMDYAKALAIIDAAVSQARLTRLDHSECIRAIAFVKKYVAELTEVARARDALARGEKDCKA